MNPKELIEKAKKSSVVSFHTFVLLHREFSSDLFCFYEGNDSQYYFPRIRNIIGDNHHPIFCGNKKSVIETFEKIKDKYPKFKTAFFIDSDFDDRIYEDEIYNTPCYSIENFYCSDIVLSRILKNEFMLKETDSAFIEVMKIFKKEQQEFHKATSLFNIWYATLKKKAKDKSIKLKTSLDIKFPKQLAIIKIGDIKATYNLETIKLKFPEVIEVNEDEIIETRNTFYNHLEPTKRHRGKYEIEFFLKFLKFIINDANVEKKIIQKKTKFNIDNAQILSQISQYAETPVCLIDYIKRKSA